MHRTLISTVVALVVMTSFVRSEVPVLPRPLGVLLVAEAPKAKTPDAPDKDVPAGAPPMSVIKSMLEVQWGPLGKTTKHIYDYKSIKIAEPTKEVVTVNGQGTFTGKLRYPVRVVCDITVKFADGTSRKETKKQTFHFFLDEFKEWTFRFIQND